MKTLAIINQTSPQADACATECAKLDLPFQLTQHAGHAQTLARQAIDEGVEWIIACGGDGTLNECVNGAYRDGKVQCLMSLQPIGSANDYARKANTSSLAELVAKSIAGKIKEHDLMLISTEQGERCVVNVSSAGIGAEIAATVNKRRYSWPFALNYYSAILGWLIHYKPPLLSIEVDGKEEEARCFLAAAGKGTFVGNGLGVLPQASLSDKLLGFSVVGNITVLDFLRYQSQLKAAQQISDERISYRSHQSVAITVSSGRLAIDADGEFVTALEAGQQVRFSALPSAMKWIG